jgi:CO/xanthine dehydrogenase Mo-binding subunit
MPIETRGLVADYSNATEQLTVWASTQVPHQVQQFLVEHVGLPAHRIRVIAPDVGGAFGAKLIVYPEDILIPWLAWRLGRPVRWIEDRREHLLSATQEREQIHDVTVAFDDAGRILGLEDRMVHDTGAYTPRGLVVPLLSATMLPGPYKIPSYRVEMSTVYTNRVPVTPYRGAGQPQAVFVMERVVDLVARRLGLDRAEVRFRNMIQPDEFPYHVGVPNYRGTGPLVYDSGDFPAVLRRALEAADYEGLKARRKGASREGRLPGIGIACYVELTGGGPHEVAWVRVDTAGHVTAFTGATSQGQGAETTLAQVCAAELGVAPEAVSVIAGDTGAVSQGWGAFASRVAVMAGTAVSLAAQEVRRKSLRLASLALEAAEADLELAAGQVRVRGAPTRAVSLGQLAGVATLAGAAHGVEPGLEATRYFQPADMAFAGGAQVVMVEVDRETGSVRVLQNILAHDSGRLINPAVVEGQVMGAVALGLGSAILEQIAYDRNGQLLTASLMDYLLPSAMEVPDLQLEHLETPSPLNPHGFKGIGESGALPAPAVIASAVEDALAPLGIGVADSPLPPARVRALIAGAGPQPETP